MSAQLPPTPCDPACFAKFILDNNSNGDNIRSMIEDATHLHRTHREGKCDIPKALIDVMPEMIADTQKIHDLVKGLRIKYRHGLGYKDQGLATITP